MQVAIDGPAGSGKSTVCKMIAEKYGLTYVDTGAMYRSIAWIAKNTGYDGLVEKTNAVEFIFEENGKVIKIKFDDNIIDLTTEIRTPEISSLVSNVAKDAEIREILVKKQQEYAKGKDVIMEGRDIASVVLPNAELKIFLTANDEERAKRRYKELEASSIEDKPTYEEVLNSIKKRDLVDSTRDTSPLTQVKDAILLDTSNLTLEEVSDKIGEMIKK